MNFQVDQFSKKNLIHDTLNDLSTCQEKVIEFKNEAYKELETISKCLSEKSDTATEESIKLDQIILERVVDLKKVSSDAFNCTNKPDWKNQLNCLRAVRILILFFP